MRSCALSISIYFTAHRIFRLGIVAEAIGLRFQRFEGFGVGLLLCGVHAARCEGYVDRLTGGLSCLLNGCTATENDQVGE